MRGSVASNTPLIFLSATARVFDANRARAVARELSGCRRQGVSSNINRRSVHDVTFSVSRSDTRIAGWAFATRELIADRELELAHRFGRRRRLIAQPRLADSRARDLPTPSPPCVSHSPSH